MSGIFYVRFSRQLTTISLRAAGRQVAINGLVIVILSWNDKHTPDVTFIG